MLQKIEREWSDTWRFYAQEYGRPGSRKEIARIKFKKTRGQLRCLNPQIAANPQRALDAAWLVQRVKNVGLYYDNIPFPEGVEEALYPQGQKRASYQTPLCLYEIASKNPDTPVDQILIGLHRDRRLSLLVYFRPGTAVGCDKALAIENQNQEELFYFFSDHMGFDRRGRAGQYVCCESPQAITNINALFQAIHALSPLSERAMELWTFIHNEAQALAIENKSWTLHPDYPNAVEITKQCWSYPNQIPDTYENSEYLTYYPEDIKHFPTEIPQIHLAVLAGDAAKVGKLLDQNWEFIYRRDQFGYLPLRLAADVHSLDCAVVLMHKWLNLDVDKKWLGSEFTEIINNITAFADSQDSLTSEVYREILRQHYFSDLFPGAPNPKAIYYCLETNDEASYQQLWQSLMQQLQGYIASIQGNQLDEFKQQLVHYVQKCRDLKVSKSIISATKCQDWDTVLKLLSAELDAIITVREQIPTLEEARVMLQANFPQRPKLHQNILKDDGSFAEKLNAELRQFHTLESELLQLAQVLSERTEAGVDGLGGFLDSCDPIFTSYRLLSPHLGDAEYTFFVKVLAIMQWSVVREPYGFKKLDIFPDYVSPLLETLLPLIPKQRQSQFKCFTRLNHKYFVSIVRQALLPSEAQDPWGYTPFILALVHGNLSIIQLCAKYNLADVLKRDKTRVLYSPLDHARENVIKTLCFYGHNPNKTRLSIFSHRNDKDYWLLMFYRYLTERNHGLLTPIDEIVLTTTQDNLAMNNLLLQILLRYHEELVIKGPYDPGLPKETVALLIHHNAQITQKTERNRKRPKLKQALLTRGEMGFFQFETHLQSHEGNEYCSELLRISSLPVVYHQTLCDIFAQNFEKLGDNAKQEGSKAFFREKILQDPDYLIEVHFDKATARPVAFACFKLLHPENESFSVLYFSLAAVHRNYANKGLIYSSMKIIPAIYQLCQEKQRTVEVYSRFGQPGLAFEFMPKNAKISLKYDRPEALVRKVAAMVGHVIEPNGSSVPPVFVRLGPDTSDNYHTAQDEYQYLQSQIPYPRDPRASLPLCFNLEEAVVQAWKDSLATFYSFDEAFFQQFFQGIKSCLTPAQSSHAEQSKGYASYL